MLMNDNLLLLGCGILRKEILYLIKRNKWPLDVGFLDSSLHINLEKLSAKLTTALDRYQDRETIIFYGACHPLMKSILEKRNTIRTPGQNCVDILLGHELFIEELEKGAFFLLEDWALRFGYIMGLTFENNPDLIKEIFQCDRKYLLCLRTPCSGEFSKEAQGAGELVGVPIRWMDVELDHLEEVLQKTINCKEQDKECRR